MAISPEEKKARRRAEYLRNRDKEIAQMREYRKNNLERCNEIAREYAAAHREEAKLRAKKWREANPERFKSSVIKAKSKRHRHYNALLALRKKRLKSQTPVWVDKKELIAVHHYRNVLVLMTGEPHHVDHIWPLKHKNFCGLNVPWNLQVIPAKENLTKHNKVPNG